MSPANPYASQSVTTASPATLVTMLYDRLLTGLSRATTAEADLGAGGYGVINTELQRVQDILAELRHTLNHDAGDVATNLDALYAFCSEQVLAANMSKDTTGLDVVAEVILDLRNAWVEACDPASTLAGVS